MGNFDQPHFPVVEKLHTDILEDKYGPIHAVVLRHDNVREMKAGSERIREARLVDENNILRTYALTFLTYDRGNTEIAAIDDEIRQGGSIGKTFRDHGYVVKKNVLDVFVVEVLPNWMQEDFQTNSPKAKARLTEFYAKKDKMTPLIYGTVLEIYSPDFRDPEVNDVDRAQINPPTGTLQAVGVPTDEIWEKLDHAAEADEWSDLDGLYRAAQEMSRPVIVSLHQKIDHYLESKKQVL